MQYKGKEMVEKKDVNRRILCWQHSQVHAVMSVAQNHPGGKQAYELLVGLLLILLMFTT